MCLKLSIIIPIYNAENSIARAIESVLSQDISEFELILVNDGSTDESLSICENIAKKNSKIILINQENSGPAKARNSGIKKSSGGYVTFLDADDYILDNYYCTMLAIAKKYNPDIIISNINLIGKENSILNNVLPKEKLLSKQEIKSHVIANYYGGGLGNIPSLVNKLYKREFLERNHILIDETRVRAEDYWFNFYAFLYAESCYAINAAFYNYKTLVDGSIMKSFRENQYNGFIKTREELLENNNELEFEIDYQKWDTEFINNTNEFILLAIKNNRWDLVNQILNDNTFNKCFKNYTVNNLHNRIIKKSQQNSLYIISKFIYKLWSTKIN